MTFLKTRAKRYFFDVYVERDRLHFQFPRPQAAAFVLEWGRNLSSFTPRICRRAAGPPGDARGYNQELAQTITAAVLAADIDPANMPPAARRLAMDLLPRR